MNRQGALIKFNLIEIILIVKCYTGTLNFVSDDDIEKIKFCSIILLPCGSLQSNLLSGQASHVQVSASGRLLRFTLSVRFQ